MIFNRDFVFHNWSQTINLQPQKYSFFENDRIIFPEKFPYQWIQNRIIAISANFRSSKLVVT